MKPVGLTSSHRQCFFMMRSHGTALSDGDILGTDHAPSGRKKQTKAIPCLGAVGEASVWRAGSRQKGV